VFFLSSRAERLRPDKELLILDGSGVYKSNRAEKKTVVSEVVDPKFVNEMF
jgi:hypothetical protein